MRIIKNVEENRNMQAYTYVSKGKFELREKPKPTLMQERDAIVKVTLAAFAPAICISSMAAFRGQYPGSRLAMRWWGLWKRLERQLPR